MGYFCLVPLYPAVLGYTEEVVWYWKVKEEIMSITTVSTTELVLIIALVVVAAACIVAFL